jgi:hypothetical protein
MWQAGTVRNRGDDVMARLKRTKDGDHIYIKAGRSKGTQQIQAEGIAWLEEKGYSIPSSGDGIQLDSGGYQYLRDHEYLHTKGEGKTHAQYSDQTLPLITSDQAATYGGPSLLLQMAGDTSGNWTLRLKLDEWEEGARNILLHNKAVEVGRWTISETTGEQYFSSLRLQGMPDLTPWLEVTPQTDLYSLYYKDHHSKYFKLTEATPAPGLQDGWQGNVFCPFKKGQLAYTWERCLPGKSISPTHCQELYWLAPSKYEPEWPGTEQRVGEAKRGWQLWRLQISSEEVSWEALSQWLSYRQIRLSYPAWRLRILNPLSSVLATSWSLFMPEQPLLVRCEPPSENKQTHASLSLASYPNAARSRTENEIVLAPNQVNYCFFPPLASGQQYRMQPRGEAGGQPIQAQLISSLPEYPSWLQGLSCTLTASGKQQVLAAFSNEQQPQPQIYQFQVPDDFSLEELAELHWSWQPSAIPCTLRWEYLAPDGTISHDKSVPLATNNALNALWQSEWQRTLAQSWWIILTLDAASFGSISLKLQLKPEKVAAYQAWWTNTHYAADFFWLDRMANQKIGTGQRAISPTVQQALQQLCQPDMPASLQHILMRLSSRQTMPLWVHLRLQQLLANVCPDSVLHPTV